MKYLKLNRLQNLAIISKCIHPEYECIEVYNETSEAWVELRENKKRVVFSKSGNDMLTIRSVNFWPQIVHKNLSDGSKYSTITTGDYEVAEILGWDEAKNEVYFLASMDDKMKNNPDVRHVFQISVNQNDQEKIPKCLTCNKKFDESLPICEYANAKISPDFTHFLLDCLGPSIPYTILVSLKSGRDEIHILEKNEEIKNKLENFLLPNIKYEDYDILNDAGGVPARVKVLLPPCFDEKHKYPIIFDV